MDLQQFDIPRYLANLPLFEEIAPADLQRLAQGSVAQFLPWGKNF